MARQKSALCLTLLGMTALSTHGAHSQSQTGAYFPPAAVQSATAPTTTVPPPASDIIGPSFPCPQPRDPLAQLICSRPDLSLLDLQFVETYQALRQQVGAEGRASVRLQSVNFGLAVRSNCGIALAQSPNSNAPPPPDAPPSATACVAQAYEQQRAIWAAQLTGDAAEEAARPLDGQAALQKQLQLLGYLPASATIDAVFGTGTRAAIVTWQIVRGKTPTGLLGNSDAAALLADTSPSPGNAQTQPSSAPQAILAPSPPQPAVATPPKPTTEPGIPAEQTGSGLTDWKALVAQALAQGVTVAYDASKQPCTVTSSMAPDTVAALTNQFISAAAADQNQQTSWHAHHVTVGMMLFQAEFSAPIVKRFYEDYASADECQFDLATSVYDDFGQPSLKDIYSFDLNRSIFSRINWEHFIPTNITKVSVKFSIDPDTQSSIAKEGAK